MAARQLQPEFRGGTWFVPLETIRERALVLPEIVAHFESIFSARGGSSLKGFG